MANSTTTLDVVPSATGQPEVPANALLDALSPASLFGRRASTTALLTWGYYGGTFLLDGVATQVANATVALTASATNFVEATRAGVVSKNTTAFTAGSIPLYTVVTNATTATSYTDHRVMWIPTEGRLVKAMADANQTLSAAEARNDVIELTGALTVQRNVVLPLTAVGKRVHIFANVTGAAVQAIGASGTGIVIAIGKHADVYSDSVNIVRATPDI